MKILIASSIAQSALDELATAHDLVYAVGASEADLAQAITGCDALVFRSGVDITATVLDHAGSLRLIVRAGSGYDNIDLDRLAEMRLRFVRIPGPGAKAVAELAFALMLGLARQVRWADREWRAGRWVKSQAQGRLLTGRSLGIVGAGNIGSRTGALGAAWGMSVTGCVELPAPSIEEALSRRGIRLAGFDQVMSESDFVSIHVPLQDSTRNLIDARVIGSMRPGSILVNLSRGGVVDELALRDALLSGHIAGAGLDVHSAEGNGRISPLADLENVVLTPHIGASTSDSQEEIGRMIVKCLADPPSDDDLRAGTPDNFTVI
ncbi:MAG TPA: NAD(P)-dependent oxidoreductase [Acidimicrobiia bacterium]|nr:NAD(P)-dependent oxidoreductase [Acidimicrobiia bacterium]